jgi:peroxidase
MLRIFTGAHTVGVAEWQFFVHRLYNFLGTGLPDPNLDPTYGNYLRNNCPEATDPSDPTQSRNVSLDFRSQFRWDLSYFRNVKQGRGLLRINDEIGIDPTTSPHFNQICQIGKQIPLLNFFSAWMCGLYFIFSF